LKNFRFHRNIGFDGKTIVVLRRAGGRTSPIISIGEIETEWSIGELSKSDVVQVWATEVLPRVEVTSSTKLRARRKSCANVRIAPAKRKALSPRIRKG